MEKGEHHQKVYRAAEALRQALAQPVDNVYISEERVHKTDKSIHEPVAWMKEWEDGHINLWLYKPTMFYEGELQPLYTAPPQKQWVGLTDEEKQRFKGLGLVGVDTVEAKLREKNT